MPSPETLNWQGVRPNVVSKTITLDPQWTGTASVKVYVSPTGRELSVIVQPEVTQTGNTLFVSFKNTAAMSNSTYVRVFTGTTVRYQGVFTLAATPAELPFPIDPETPVSIPTIITSDMVMGLSQALEKKLEVVLSTSAGATTAAQSGPSKLILEIINGTLSAYVYTATSTPKLQKILTY